MYSTSRCSIVEGLQHSQPVQSRQPIAEVGCVLYLLGIYHLSFTNMSQQGNRKSDQDAFLASMTFSSVDFGRGCECDECDQVPSDIRRAIQAHKRLKLQHVPLMRTQDRALVAREESITVWKWTMPLNAEPLIEYGNNHRIVFVAHLPKVIQR